MAASMIYPQISYDEIEINELQEIGCGSFGTIYKANWRNQRVAVKRFLNNANGKEIENELRHLSRVSLHPNIINFYGVSRHNSEIFLIMEYANCGSLETLLYGPDQYNYTEAHALNWMLQCAQALAFLHDMHPKPILHRNLKPANLLLVNEYRTLKICDFGSAAELKTMMTQTKGSMAWMAPEVLIGQTYTEKCDVFSFAVALWEVLSRQQPYESFENYFAIGYYVMRGGRLELNKNWPEEVQKLIQICWDPEPSTRPDMKSIAKSLKDIIKNFVGGDTPIGEFFTETLQSESDEEVLTFNCYDGAERSARPDMKRVVRKRYLEINYEEIKEMKSIGQGSFGTVYQAKWYNRSIAVKAFRTHVYKDKNKIENEIDNLCRLASHRNIIGFYGVCRHNSETFLIMEYANCGSLQNFLHYPPKYDYTEAHALNWMLQCAQAIEYLHTMDSKPILHRDLKPANLLLVDEYRTLKICDFGTVAVLKTCMTQAKGSVPWMAPEVLNGNAYTEKCDVFSFGITLWEVFARQQPYERFEVEFAIGYHVLHGGRLELDEKWPEEVKGLIKICWDQEPSARPEIRTVVRSLQDISKNCVDGDAPLGPFSKMVEPSKSDAEVTDHYSESNSLDLTPLKIGSEEMNSVAADKQKEWSTESVDAECYLIKKAGFMLIISQFDDYMTDHTLFHNISRNEIENYRRTMELDRNKLISTFSSFGYIPIARNDCSSSDIIDFLNETVQMSDNYDSLIVCILSITADGVIYGSDKVPLRLTIIQHCMNANVLKGKPKMLIVQGYHKVEIADDENNVLVHDDMITVRAGNFGLPSEPVLNGSWFIRTFCKRIDTSARNHILDILAAVERDYQESDPSNRSAMAHQTTHYLQKRFYLPKRR